MFQDLVASLVVYDTCKNQLRYSFCRYIPILNHIFNVSMNIVLNNLQMRQINKRPKSKL